MNLKSWLYFLAWSMIYLASAERPVKAQATCSSIRLILCSVLSSWSFLAVFFSTAKMTKFFPFMPIEVFPFLAYKFDCLKSVFNLKKLAIWSKDSYSWVVGHYKQKNNIYKISINLFIYLINESAMDLGNKQRFLEPKWLALNLRHLACFW